MYTPAKKPAHTVHFSQATHALRALKTADGDKFAAVPAYAEINIRQADAPAVDQLAVYAGGSFHYRRELPEVR